jgi:hypothetical protein
MRVNVWIIVAILLALFAATRYLRHQETGTCEKCPINRYILTLNVQRNVQGRTFESARRGASALSAKSAIVHSSMFVRKWLRATTMKWSYHAMSGVIHEATGDASAAAIHANLAAKAPEAEAPPVDERASDSKSAHSTGLKTRLRVVRGSGDPAVEHRIGPGDYPVNILGGHRWPDALKLGDVRETLLWCEVCAPPDDDLAEAA